MSFSTIIYDVLQLIGSLGLFLFGVKFMSDSIQKTAGAGMKSILTFVTNHPLKGIFTGFFVTVIVQSSTITTVLLVSFVNAGMLTLAQSIGVIMGANIGTTITGWIISILELKFKFSSFSLPIIGLAFPFIFSKNKTYKYLAEFTIGFALMFIGFSFLKESVPNIQANPEILEFVKDYTDMGYLSILIFILVGGTLTFILQSSSAAITLTIVLIFNGWIDIRTGAAMILGENIGTTLTAQIAALVANNNAKRAAMAHTIFNLFGVAWMFILFNPFLNMIEWVIKSLELEPPMINDGLPNNEITYQGALTLSLFHTTFNIANTFVLFFFRNQISRFTEWLLPEKTTEKKKKLKYLKNSFIATPEVGLFEINKEMQLLCKKNHRLFNLVHMLTVRKNINISKLLERYNKTHEESRIAIEQINHYLSELANTDYGEALTRPLRMAWDNLNHLTEINDLCLKVAKKVKDAHLSKISLSESQIKELSTLLVTLNQAFDATNLSFNQENKEKTKQYEDKAIENFKNIIHELKEDISDAHFLQIENGSISAQVAFTQIELSELLDRLAYHLDKIKKNNQCSRQKS